MAHRRPGCDHAFLVFDFGGGTLDISIVDCFDNVVAISAVSGDMHLGGADFDEAIAREVCRVNGRDFDRLGDDAQALLLECEAAKRALVDDETEVFVHGRDLGFSEPLRLTNEVLFGLSCDLLARIERPIRRALADSDVDIEDISRVLMVGGSSHMPVVRHYLHSLLAVPVSIADECDTAVALGLGVYAGIRQRCDEARDLVLTDICPPLPFNRCDESRPARIAEGKFSHQAQYGASCIPVGMVSGDRSRRPRDDHSRVPGRRRLA